MELISTVTSKAEQYKIRSGAGAHQMKDFVGTVLAIDKIDQYITTRTNGEEAVCTSIITKDGDVYQSLSPTIDKCCKTLFETFGDDINTVNVRISEGTSKGGRNFLALEFAL